MVQTSIKPITLEDFLKLPETKPASEFIDGQMLQKPMPQGKHSTIQGDLVSAIDTVLKPERIARAYPELRCTFGGRSIVPDVAVFAWERIPRDDEYMRSLPHVLWIDPPKSQTNSTFNHIRSFDGMTPKFLGFLAHIHQRTMR